MVSIISHYNNIYNFIYIYHYLLFINSIIISCGISYCIVNLLGPWWTAWSTPGLVDQPYEEMVAAFMARFLDMDLAKVAGRIPWDSMAFHGIPWDSMDQWWVMDIYIYIFIYIYYIIVIIVICIIIMIMMIIFYYYYICHKWQVLIAYPRHSQTLVEPAVVGRVNVRRVDYETDYVKESETFPGDFQVDTMGLSLLTTCFQLIFSIVANNDMDESWIMNWNHVVTQCHKPSHFPSRLGVILHHPSHRGYQINLY